MERKHKITIPEPCHENWGKMKPNENGRFCLSCSKTVVDFTSMLPDEIQHFFIQNQNEKICGRFRKSQLDTIIIQIPSRVLYAQTNYYKIFLLALFVAMGTTLFSCTDKDGNRNRIDKIEIINKTLQDQDESEPAPVCYGHQIEPKKVKQKKQPNQDFFVTGVLVPAMETGSFKYDIIYNSDDLDVLPTPKDGMKKFYSFFYKNYTASKKEKVSILFIVEKDGSLSNFNIIKNNSTGNEEDIIKVLSKAPEWIPGKFKNRIVRSSYILQLNNG